MTENLRKSFEKLGPIYPILVDKQGNVIDGFHRREVNKDWPVVIVDSDDAVKSQIIALVANVNRREITKEEITKRLDALAASTGWAPMLIAEEVGMSYEWVCKYLSQEYKNPVKVNAGEVSAAQRATAPDIGSQITEAADSGLGAPETTMTEEEAASLGMRKIMISIPVKDVGILEAEAEKKCMMLSSLLTRIVGDWIKRRRL